MRHSSPRTAPPSPQPVDPPVSRVPAPDLHGRRVDRATGHHAITARGLHSRRIAMGRNDSGASQ